MALNPNYEAIGKAFTTQYYQVLFLTSRGFMNLAGKIYDSNTPSALPPKLIRTPKL